MTELEIPFVTATMNTADSEKVLYRVEDRIAHIILNRPQKLNALTEEMIQDVARAFRRFDLDPEAHVAVFYGNGRAFCTGADVNAMQRRPKEEFEQFKAAGSPATREVLANLYTNTVNWKPVITAIHGYALGIGLTLSFQSDLIVAAADAVFEVTEISRGSGGGNFWPLFAFRSPSAFIDEVVLTGRRFTGSEAAAQGLVNKSAAPGGHLDAALDYAAAILKNPPLAVRQAVRVRRWYLQEFVRQSRLATEVHQSLHLTEDFREAVAAYAERRPPQPFKGR
jgi:enoyl-CoA hydratase/carnithine racemase